MRARGVSLQKIRVLESELRRSTQQVRPFALEAFWTDGVDVWFALEPNDRRLIQATGRHRRQVAWQEAVARFADEVQYDSTGVAELWRPAPHVVIDPAILFGEPVVEGTRIAVQTIVVNLAAGSAADVARWFDLTVDQVDAASAYAASLS